MPNGTTIWYEIMVTIYSTTTSQPKLEGWKLVVGVDGEPARRIVPAPLQRPAGGQPPGSATLVWLQPNRADEGEGGANHRHLDQEPQHLWGECKIFRQH